MILCEKCVKAFGKDNAQPASALMVYHGKLSDRILSKFLCGDHAYGQYMTYHWEYANIDVYTDGLDLAMREGT